MEIVVSPLLWATKLTIEVKYSSPKECNFVEIVTMEKRCVHATLCSRL